MRMPTMASMSCCKRMHVKRIEKPSNRCSKSVRSQLHGGQLPLLIRKQVDVQVTLDVIRGVVPMHPLHRRPT